MAPDAPTRERAGEKRDRSRPPAPEPLPRPVVDNHCHLDIADGSWLPVEEALSEAAAVGVPRIVQIGCDLPGAQWAVDVAERFDAIVAGVALHPNETPLLAADRRLEEALETVERPAAGGCVPWARPGSTTSGPTRRGGPPSTSRSAATSTWPSGSERPWSST